MAGQWEALRPGPLFGKTQFVEVVWPEIVGTSLATKFRLDVDEVGVLGPASSELP